MSKQVKHIEIEGGIKDNFEIEVDEDASLHDVEDEAFRVMKARMKSIGIPKFIWNSFKVNKIEDRDEKIRS